MKKYRVRIIYYTPSTRETTIFAPTDNMAKQIALAEIIDQYHLVKYPEVNILAINGKENE